MIMRIEMEHNIEPDQTQQAIKWMREVNTEDSHESRISIIKRILLADGGDKPSGGTTLPELAWQLQPPSKVRVRLYT